MAVLGLTQQFLILYTYSPGYISARLGPSSMPNGSDTPDRENNCEHYCCYFGEKAPVSGVWVHSFLSGKS